MKTNFQLYIKLSYIQNYKMLWGALIERKLRTVHILKTVCIAVPMYVCIPHKGICQNSQEIAYFFRQRGGTCIFSHVLYLTTVCNLWFEGWIATYSNKEPENVVDHGNIYYLMIILIWLRCRFTITLLLVCKENVFFLSKVCWTF